MTFGAARELQDPERDPASYRDPSGFVFTREGRLLRQVNRVFGADWEALTTSGLLADLWERRLMVRHQGVDLAAALTEDATAVIEPERVPFITYPYEWTFSQLQDAALLTLQAQTLAEARGMTLRDASAFNVQFLDGQPILIDSLSFKRTRSDAPWEPYRQFCEHFLAPLALMARRDPRLSALLRDFVDGIPLDLAARLLPGRTRLSLGLSAHVHLHARAQRRHASDVQRPPAVRLSPGRRAVLVDHLRRTVSGLKVSPGDTEWAHYADASSYAPEAMSAKEAAVREMLERLGGGITLDIGANTGRFSAIAAEMGHSVVALDADWAAAERHYRSLRDRGERRVLPLVADIVSPSPALGWANRERSALLERLHGDVAMALALVHHLAIGRNVPLRQIAQVMAGAARHLIIEWVPKTDPMCQRLLLARDDVFADYTEGGFRSAFDRYFSVRSSVKLPGSDRLIYLMEALPSASRAVINSRAASRSASSME